MKHCIIIQGGEEIPSLLYPPAIVQPHLSPLDNHMEATYCLSIVQIILLEAQIVEVIHSQSRVKENVHLTSTSLSSHFVTFLLS